MGGGEDIAQIVIDLAHRGAEIGEPAALIERMAQFFLHARELALGNADLVAALRGNEDPLGVGRVPGELHHRAGDAAHRAHQQPVDGEEDEARGEDRDDDRQQHHIARIAQHLGEKLLFLEDDGHLLAEAVGRRAEDADHAMAAAGEGGEGLPEHGHGTLRAQIIARIDMRRRRALEHQAAAIGKPEGDGLDAGGDEKLLLEPAADGLMRGLEEGEGGDLRRIHPLLEEIAPEIGDRRHPHEDLDHHHEADGQKQQPRRQAAEQ